MSINGENQVRSGVARDWSMQVLLAIGMLSLALMWSQVRAAEQNPVELIRGTTEQVRAGLVDTDPASAQRVARDLVKRIVMPHLDLKRISRWVIGKHWKHASEEQKARFVEAFGNLLVNTYAAALAENREFDIRYLPFTGAKGRKAVVRTEVQQPGAPVIPINYKMYRHKGEWKAYDVTVDGISLVANYRTSFTAELRRKGLDQLIERLETHNQGVEPTRTASVQ
jgi:phospholipid transport system substrate-binding protein